jgi:hypothetical protein
VNSCLPMTSYWLIKDKRLPTSRAISVVRLRTGREKAYSAHPGTNTCRFCTKRSMRKYRLSLGMRVDACEVPIRSQDREHAFSGPVQSGFNVRFRNAQAPRDFADFSLLPIVQEQHLPELWFKPANRATNRPPVLFPDQCFERKRRRYFRLSKLPSSLRTPLGLSSWV